MIGNGYKEFDLLKLSVFETLLLYNLRDSDVFKPKVSEAHFSLLVNFENPSTLKDINYWKKNAEKNYSNTPISVLNYISELETLIKLKN